MSENHALLFKYTWFFFVIIAAVKPEKVHVWYIRECVMVHGQTRRPRSADESWLSGLSVFTVQQAGSAGEGLASTQRERSKTCLAQ